MNRKNIFKATLISTGVAVAMAPVSVAADSGLTGSAGVASQYLWRAVTFSDHNAIVYGGLEYGHESGLYGGFFTTTEGDQIEYDLYGGFGGSAGAFSYDLGIIQYRYTIGGQQRVMVDDDGEVEGFGVSARRDGEDFQEAYVILGFDTGVGEIGAEAHLGWGEFGSTDEDVEDDYFALTYNYDRVGVTLGYYDLEDMEVEIDGEETTWDPSYTHLDLSYEVHDGLTFTYSKIIDEEEEGQWQTAGTFVVSYDFAF